MTDWGQMAAARLDEIARISLPGPGVTRLPYTPQHDRAITLLTRWMQEAGLETHLDAAGTLAGRRTGPRGAGTFYVGSHQDSVRQGGAFDGIMGVVLPILALNKLTQDGVTLPFTVEVLAFADEEGVRFPTALVGSRALAGTFDPTVLTMTDKAGITLRSAMMDFGLDPDQIAQLRRPAATALGYLEAHIEQGPVLEDADQALGVVTAICGIERHQITLTGQAGHAGTLPMAARRDALVGAAAIITRVNQLGRGTADLRATVGELHLAPNVVNAVPRQVRLTVELRSPDDAIREAAGRQIVQFSQEIAADSRLLMDSTRSYHQPAQPCDAALTETLTLAVQQVGARGLALPSGATHDASAMADLCPIAMLFVRCRGGVSHTPDEFAAPHDLNLAIDAMTTFFRALARKSR